MLHMSIALSEINVDDNIFSLLADIQGVHPKAAKIFKHVKPYVETKLLLPPYTSVHPNFYFSRKSYYFFLKVLFFQF